MMKSVCLISRRSGSTPEAFRDYYENHHSRLGSRYFPFTKYVRNYLVSASPSVDFDVITEFFFDPNVNVAGVHSGRVREILDEDERNFMEQQLIRPAASAPAAPVSCIKRSATRSLLLSTRSTKFTRLRGPRQPHRYDAGRQGKNGTLTLLA
ncbi:MAG: EthD domain-containing protein, partial [Haliea sp.]|nr:EthD domain-containing protein [Haliea sp.]